MPDLVNRAGTAGTYDGIATNLSSLAVTTQMIDLTMSLTADKTLWADGNLTYTIAIVNNGTLPYLDVVVTDTLDISMIEFVEDSVTLDAAAYDDYTYDSSTGLLTITLPTEGVLAAATSTITFQVQKTAPTP